MGLKSTFTFVFFISCLATSALFAKEPAADTAKKILPPIQKFFVGTAMDGGIFSTATIQQQQPGSTTTTNTIGSLRFSYVINFGFTFNYNFGRHVGIYTGIDIKNIGYIENTDGFTYKRRTYNIGAPLGIKIGNMAAKRFYIFLGGGADVPFNYKEKQFQIRNEKTKFSEWFSSRTPAVMPYLFAGAAIKRGVSFKLQYYPTNFLNPGFTDTKNTNNPTPYAGMEVHLILFSVGLAIPLSKQPDIVEKQVNELHTM